MISGNLRILLLASGLALALFMIILLKKNKNPEMKKKAGTPDSPNQ